MIPGYVMQQISRHEGQVGAAEEMVARAGGLMDLVRALNNRPQAAPCLRGLASVKTADSRLMRLAQRRADEFIFERLKKIQGLGGSDDYRLEVVRLRQELRFLSPVLWHSVQSAERSLLAMDRSQNVARERCGG